MSTDLITLNNGIALLEPEIAEKIAKFERKIKEIKEVEDNLRAGILEEMEAKGIRKLETEDFTITYKDSYEKEQFQTKQLRVDDPDLYDRYIKFTSVKSSIVIKLKEDKDGNLERC